MKERDIILIDIVSQQSIELSEEDFNDLHSAIGFTAKNYPPKGAKNFKASLKKLDKKFWKFIRKLK